MKPANWSQRAILIAVGTEVTSGQIKNSHGTYLAAQLDDFGIEPVLHLAVPDDEELMLQAFASAEKTGAFIFITGGLGPTRDDFTRDIVSKWTKKQLVFDDQRWVELQEKLALRKVTISENHKKQCYYPNGSKILSNSVGTAHGFFLTYNDLKIWVLPGPTPELNAIWSEHVRPQLAELGLTKKHHLLKWKCLGLPESEAADLVEAALAGSGLQTGYRLTTPFVEVKVWFPIEMDAKNVEKWKSALESAIGKNIVLKNDSDQALRFLELFNKQSITVVDRVTAGQFAERLNQTLRDNRSRLSVALETLSVSHAFDSSYLTSDLVVELNPHRGGGTTLGHKWELEIRTLQGSTTYSLSFETKAKVNPDRLGKVAIELVLQKLLQEFDSERSEVH